MTFLLLFLFAAAPAQAAFFLPSSCLKPASGCLQAFSKLNELAEPPGDVPDWLSQKVGLGENQIAPVVLERARAHYVDKVKNGQINGLCYMAMDATKPHRNDDGSVMNRFYLICESLGIYLPISAGHGSGVQYKDQDFSNGKKCGKNFSNASGSLLTMGGRYLTGNVIYSYKGMARDPKTGKFTEFSRPFVEYSGEGETADSASRNIGGHPSQLVTGGCFRHDPANARADKDGDVYYGDLVDYTDGRSNGCTSWNPEVAEFVVDVLKQNRGTLYIYPESADIAAVAKAVADQVKPESRGLYWNAECLSEIKQPTFLSSADYDGVFAKIAKDKADEAAKNPPSPKKMCTGDVPDTPKNGKDEK